MTAVATTELDALVRREHFNPHGVLGAHPADDGVVIRALRPAACEIRAHLRDGSTVELERIHAGGVFEGVVRGRRAAAALPARGRLRAGRQFHDRGPLPVHPDDRRARPAPDRRRPPRAALRRARLPRPRARRRPGHRVCRVGAGRASGQRRRRLQLVGRPPARDAHARAPPASGSCFSRSRARDAVQVRDPDRRARAAAEGRPLRAGGRAAAEDGVGRDPAPPQVEQAGRQVAGAPPRADPAERSRCRSTRSISAPGG